MKQLPLRRLREGEHFLFHGGEIQSDLLRYRQTWRGVMRDDLDVVVDQTSGRGLRDR